MVGTWPLPPSRIALALLRACRAKARHHLMRKELLRLDRLPMFKPTSVDRDRDLGETLSQLLYGLNALDDLVRRADPHDVPGDHLVVGHLGEFLDDPGSVEAVA